MEEEILDAQRELIETVTAAGWEITETELSVYESPWEDTHDPEATITLTARRPFPETDEDDEDSPYRVQ